MAYMLQDPSEKLNYSFSWAGRLGSANIVASIWSIIPAGPTIETASVEGLMTTAYLSGLVDGEVYRLINAVVTNAGTTESDSVTIRCQKR